MKTVETYAEFCREMMNAAHDCTVRRGMIYDSTTGEATIKLMKP